MKLSTGILLLTLCAISFGAMATGLPWINDNFPQALAEAKQRKLPIFVEVWAPW